MKKTIALLLVAVMALSLTSAFASSPVDYVEPVVVTPTNTNAGAGTGTGAGQQQEAPVNFVFRLIEAALNEKAAEQLEKLNKFVAEGNPVAKFFPEEVQNAVTAKLPAGAALDALELNELEAVETENAGAAAKAYDEVLVKIAFTTNYADAEAIYPILRLENADGSVTWHLVEAEIEEDGSVTLHLPSDLLAKFEAAVSAVMFVLNTPFVVK